MPIRSDANQGSAPQLYEDAGEVSISSISTSKTAYSQLIASTARRITQMVLSISALTRSGGVEADYLIDIAVGGAGAEVIKIPNLRVRSAGANVAYFTFTIPIDIPGGSRIAVRAAMDTGTSGSISLRATIGGRS